MLGLDTHLLQRDLAPLVQYDLIELLPITLGIDNTRVVSKLTKALCVTFVLRTKVHEGSRERETVNVAVFADLVSQFENLIITLGLLSLGLLGHCEAPVFLGLGRLFLFEGGRVGSVCLV